MHLYIYRAGASDPVGQDLAGPIFEVNVGVAAALTTNYQILGNVIGCRAIIEAQSMLEFLVFVLAL